MADVGRQALKQESGRRSGGLRRVNTARAIFRDAERVADEDEQKKIAEWARRSQSLERLKAMWTLAKADLAVSPEELDTDPMLLNVENARTARARWWRCFRTSWGTTAPPRTPTL